MAAKWLGPAPWRGVLRAGRLKTVPGNRLLQCPRGTGTAMALRLLGKVM